MSISDNQYSIEPNSNRSSKLFDQRKHMRNITLLSVTVLILALTITLVLWKNISDNIHKNAENRFNSKVIFIKDAMINRMNSYETILRGVRGLMVSSDEVTRDDFKSYVESLGADGKLQDLQAVGFSVYVNSENKEKIIKKAISEVPTYKIRPENNQGDSVLVYYNEPVSPSNLVALGFDMFSDPTRKEALIKARDTGVTSITGKVSLIQDNVKHSAFIMYMPIYQKMVSVPISIKERREKNIGFGVIACRFNDLMKGILGQEQHDIEIKIFDGQTPRNDKILYDSDTSNNSNQNAFDDKKSQFKQKALLEINGRTWLLTLNSTAKFEESIDRSAEFLVAFSGVMIGLLLFSIILVLSRTKIKALNLAEKMTSAFKESEERYRQMFMKNQSVKLLIDPKNGQIIDANSAASVFYGYTIETLKSMNINEINTLPSEEVQIEMNKASVDKHRYFRFKHKLASGELKDVEVYSGIITVHGHSLLHSIIHDITQRTRAEDAQRQTESQLIKQLFFTQTLIDTLPNPIFYKDTQGRYLGCNKAFENFIGLPQDKIIGKTVSDISPNDISKKYHDMDLSLLKDRGFQIYESSVRFADGSYHDVIFNKAVFYESDGRLGGLVGIIIDISERKQMEDRLRQTNDKLRSANDQLALVLEGTHDGFWDLDFPKKQIQISQRLKIILGYDENDSLSSDFDFWINKIHLEDIQNAKTLFDQHLKHQNAYYIAEYRIQCKNGDYKWVMIRGRVVKWDSFNNPLRCAGILSDISERKTFEEQLHHQKEFLRQVIDSDPNIIFVKDQNGSLILINEAMANLFETTVDHLLYKTSDDFMTPENSASCTESDHLVILNHQTVTVEEQYISPSGKIHHFLITKKPLVTPDYSIQILCVGLNITESKKAEQALRESETRLKEITSSLGEAIYVIDKFGVITFTNPETCNILGFEKHELIGQVAHNLFHHTHEDGRPYLKEDCWIANSVFSGKEYKMIEDTFWTKENRRVPVSVIAMPIVRDGKIEGGVISFHDITKELVIRQTLHQALLEQETILETMVVGMALISNRKIIWINSRLEEMLGYDRQEVLEGSTELYFRSRDKWLKFGEEAMPVLYRGESFTVESELYHKNGEKLWCLMNGKMIDITDPERGIIWIIQDVTERRKFEEKIKFMAHYDALTRLPNRVTYKDRLEQALLRAERNQFKLAVMFIDLDKFKYVNDTLGHGVGDILLQQVSERLISCVRRSDTVSRFGGDEFVILLPEINNDDAVVVVSQKILKQLTEIFDIQDHFLQIGCSIGIACFPRDGRDSETLMKHADTAMYQVKESGRNNFAFYSRES